MTRSKTTVIMIAAIAVLTGCGGKTVKPETRVEKPKVKYENIAPKMKIYGTGENFRGVVRKDEKWASSGNPPHFLILDGHGVYGKLQVKGMENIDSLTVSVKQQGIYHAPAVLSPPEGKEFQTAELDLGGVKGDKLRLEFSGTNISVAEIGLYGIYEEDTNYILAKEYKMTPKEKELLSQSGKEYGKKNYAEAIRLNEEVIRLNPENPYPYMNLGEIYHAMSDDTEDYDRHVLWMNRSLENYESGDMAENPERRVLLDRLVKVLCNNFLDVEKALMYEEKALKVLEANGMSGERLARKYGSLARSYDMQTQGPQMDEAPEAKKAIKRKAFEYYEKMADYLAHHEVNPGDNGFGETLYQLKNVYLMGFLGKEYINYEKSVDLCRLMVEKLPQTEVVYEGHVQQGMAMSLMALGRWEEAIEAWKGSYNQDLGNIKILGISYCYLKLNKVDAAYLNYALFKLFDGNNPISNKLKDKIKPVFDNIRIAYHVRDSNGIFIPGSNVYQASIEATQETLSIFKKDILTEDAFSAEVIEKTKKHFDDFHIPIAE